MSIKDGDYCHGHRRGYDLAGHCDKCDEENHPKPKIDVVIGFTNDELSILKQLLRKSGDEFSELQTNKAHKDVYVKVMQTPKHRHKKGCLNG